MVNYPSSLLSGDGGVFSLAVDVRVFASLSRAVGGMMKQEGMKGVRQTLETRFIGKRDL